MPTMTPVAQDINPPDVGKGIANLSGILGIKQQQQNLQTGLYAQRRAAALAQEEGINAQAQQEVNDYFSQLDPDKWHDEHGVLDPSKIIANDPNYKKLSGQAKMQATEKMLNMQQGQTKNVTDLASLDSDSLGRFQQGAGAFATNDIVLHQDEKDPKTGVNPAHALVRDWVTNWGKINPANQAIANKWLPVLDQTPDGQMSGSLRRLELQAQTGAQQMQTTKPGGGAIQTKKGIQEFNVNPYAPQPVGSNVGGPTEENVTPPAYVTAPNQAPAVVGPGGSNPEVLQPGAGTAPPRTAPAARAAGPATPATALRNPNGHAWTSDDGAPGAFAAPRDQASWNEATAAAKQHITEIRTQDANYGQNIALASNIRRLADAGGPWSAAWQNTVTGAGLSPDITNFNLLGAYLENQAIQLQHSMGMPGTNAGMEQAGGIASKQTYSPEAIKQKTDYLLALVEGQHRYRQALDRVEGFTNNPNPSTVAMFNSQWKNNFDPRIMEGQAAYARGQKEGDAFMARLQASMPSKAAWNQFIQKRSNLMKLENGELPQ